jgi:hypothetical protein
MFIYSFKKRIANIILSEIGVVAGEPVAGIARSI